MSWNKIRKKDSDLLVFLTAVAIFIMDDFFSSRFCYFRCYALYLFLSLLAKRRKKKKNFTSKWCVLLIPLPPNHNKYLVKERNEKIKVLIYILICVRRRVDFHCLRLCVSVPAKPKFTSPVRTHYEYFLNVNNSTQSPVFSWFASHFSLAHLSTLNYYLSSKPIISLFGKTYSL